MNDDEERRCKEYEGKNIYLDEYIEDGKQKKNLNSVKCFTVLQQQKIKKEKRQQQNAPFLIKSKREH